MQVNMINVIYNVVRIQTKKYTQTDIDFQEIS